MLDIKIFLFPQIYNYVFSKFNSPCPLNYPLIFNLNRAGENLNILFLLYNLVSLGRSRYLLVTHDLFLNLEIMGQTSSFSDFIHNFLSLTMTFKLESNM